MKRCLPAALISAIAVLFLVSCNSGSAPPESASTTSDVTEESEVAAPPAVVPASQRTSVSAQPGSIDNNYLLGKFNPASRSDFSAIGKPYADKSGMMLRKEATDAFKKMWEAAKKEGVSLKIISSTRTFAQQKSIWEGKWSRFAAEAPDPETRARKILEYSAMPGASRHHWGTDVDLNDLNNAAFERGGKYEKVYQWLAAHAHEYGFCQPYTAGRPHGYNEEKWHWSYAPLSKPFLEQYKANITDVLLTGFQGATTAASIQVVQHYALGINEDCK